MSINPFSVSINQITPQESFTEELNQWINKASLSAIENRNRDRVQSEFLNFMNPNQDKLTLSFLTLASLPDIFYADLFQSKLKKLNLNYNNLQALPESFSNLQVLRCLEVGANRFTSLPEAIGRLQNLEELVLSSNRLTSLPESFSSLQTLRCLDLGANRFTSLPEAIGRLQNLEELVFNSNRLTNLPESFSNLQALKRLDLKANRLTSLPEVIGRLQNLEELVLSSNRLTSLPEFFTNLRTLERLDLDVNRFTSFPRCFNNLPRLNRVILARNNLTDLSELLPDNLQQLERLDLGYNRALSGFPTSILQLSSRCTVDFTGCGLSQGVLRRVHEEIMTSSYAGPRISFSWDRPISNQIEEKTIEESLKDLYKKAKQPLTILPSAEESVKLRSWLSRLSSMIDYQREGGVQKTLANKIIGYLHLTREDPAFRDSFYEIIEDASGSCGDRMSLSILYLGIAYQLITIDTEDMKALSNFLLKGPWTLEMLGKLARNKIASLHFFDEIEVYLGYPIKLKQELEIPIDVEEMLYFDCSALTTEDLQEAKDFVLSQREDEALCFEFLINHDKWKRALESKYPREFQRAKTNKNAALEAAEDSYGYESAKKKFNISLIDLTRRVLS